MTDLTIDRLEEIVASLPPQDKALFQRIYEVTTTVGELNPPPSMAPWVRQQFGSIEAVKKQTIVRVTNQITSEGALFNRRRASRPILARETESIESQLENARRQDIFAHPEKDTPEDLFGRVTGRHCITASNVAKYDGLHGVIIFNEFNPLNFSREQIIDYIDTGWEWAQRAHKLKPEARYFLFIWNCLWRAGASIHHGHAQVMLTTHRHYARIEGLRQAALNYKQNYGSNYFADLFQIHQLIDCALEKKGVKILTHLTPFKNNEVILMSEALNLSLKKRIYEVLTFFRDRLGVTSFNLSLITPPLAQTEESWAGFPVLVRLLDRGDLGSRASDVGGMEIYAQSIISSDPLDLAAKLRQYLAREVGDG